ncbi:MAG: hypothetical protein HFG66_13750 [Hungatella sp.]|nr:hypothetical protein [Hungatella sp.]
MKIQHNMAAVNAQRNISTIDRTMSKTLEKLSSGYKINRAGDNAAGLAVSEEMRAQITIMNQARRNTQDGLSLIQTVEGALTEVHAMLNRMKGMSVQAANGTYTDSQRTMMNSEMDQLKEEIAHIGTSTNFSGVPLFTNGGTRRDITLSAFYGCTLDLSTQTVKVNYAGSTGKTGRVSSSSGYEDLAEKIATEYIPNSDECIQENHPLNAALKSTIYIGYLASGSGSVSAQNIAQGMDKIFADLLTDMSLNDALKKHTGGKITDSASLEALFDNPSSDLTAFVRQLSVASKGGAGSVIAPAGLNAGGSSVIGNSVTQDAPFYIGKWSIGAAGHITICVGGYNNNVDIDLFRLDSRGLGITDTNILTLDDANSAVDDIDSAINRVSQMRSHYGAMQNRLEHTLSNLENTVENLSAAESRIRDTDMAEAVTEHVRNQIILQSGQSMLAQANRIPESILSLLG